MNPPTDTPITFAEWQRRATELNTRVRALERLIVADARRTAQRAGLDPQICFLHAHNALVSYEYGKPWSDVNYSLLRRVLWLEKRSWEPSRMAERILSRLWQRVAR